MKKLFILLATISTLTVYSQNVEIVYQSNLKNLPEGKMYAFLEPGTDTSKVQFVATIRAKDKNRKSNIESLYFEIRKQANELGANCYRIKSFKRGGEKDETILVLDCYFASDSLLKINTANHEKNVVFIFGSEREDDDPVSFKLNGETIDIKAGTYYKIVLKEGVEVKVSKGGFSGAAMWLNWEKDKQPSFYALSGFGLNGAGFQPPGGIGVSFNTGRINRIGNISLGLLFTQLLKQGN